MLPLRHSVAKHKHTFRLPEVSMTDVPHVYTTCVRVMLGDHLLLREELVCSHMAANVEKQIPC